MLSACNIEMLENYEYDITYIQPSDGPFFDFFAGHLCPVYPNTQSTVLLMSCVISQLSCEPAQNPHTWTVC